MPSSSRRQQRFFGWVHACQKGTTKNCPSNILKTAGSISPKDAEDFARTKHDGLPEKKKKKMKKDSLKSFREFMSDLAENTLDAQNKGIAAALQMTPDEEQQLKSENGGLITPYVRKMGILLSGLEKRLGGNNNQAAENTDEWHSQAIKMLFMAFKMAAAGGKKQWNNTMLRKNIVQNMNGRQQQQQSNTPQQQQPQVKPATGGGPTPLNNLG
jgi:hypothetical protein